MDLHGRQGRSAGSSPLARGLRLDSEIPGHSDRIIPARAGFTSSPVSRASFAPGSSPLARGLPAESPQNMRYLRIIPARAGFTGRRRQRRASATDHPRSRGVYPTPGRFECDRSGSSPLARGLPECRPRPAQTPRIIPARAGFTRLGRRSVPHGWDHPRSRGVYVWGEAEEVGEDGSSPLARGLPGTWSLASSRQRIIPARAGFTSSHPSTTPGMRDHPRSRGVYVSDGFVDFLRVGSSPLARGLRSGRVRRDAHPRIIPARAGFTPPGVAPRTAIADHPRSRGVYDATTGYQSLPTGSSPLARGLRTKYDPLGKSAGIIPARAGFTL